MSVFNTIQGTSVTSFRIGLTGPTIYTGSADPTVTPPTPLADGFRDGDLYFRTAAGGAAIWVFDTAVWMQIASGAGGGSFAGDIEMQPGAQILGDEAAIAAAPAYAFDNDADTGIFQNLPNEISFSTGGIERFIIESNGTLASTTAGYEALIGAANDIPNIAYTDLVYMNIAGDTMTGDLTMDTAAQIFLDAGTATDPAIGFTGDTDTGFYLDAVGSMGVTAAGTKIATATINGIQMFNGAQFIGGTSSAASPTVAFNGDLTTGIFHDGSAGEIGISSGGTEVVRIDGTSIDTPLRLLTQAGIVTLPAYSFTADPNTGIYHTVNADEISFSTGGADALVMNTTSVEVAAAHTLMLPPGTAALPAINFAANNTTGIYQSVGGHIDFSINGTQTAFIDDLRFAVIDGTVAAPSLSFISELGMGFFRPALNNIAIAIDGVNVMNLNKQGVAFRQNIRTLSTKGSIAEPSFAWSDDDDTGIYNISPNSMGFSTGGVSRWEIKSNGDLEPSAATYNIADAALRIDTVYALIFDGTATALQADLAERYTVGDCCELEPGDVVVICDHEDHDICKCDHDGDECVLGVVSTAPAFMMNNDAGDDKTAPYISLRGRVPVKVCGDVKKGDLLVTSCDNPGHARSLTRMEIDNSEYAHAVFAKALRSHDDELGDGGVVEAVIL